MMGRERLIISTDVETLGRIPGLHPLLSIGAAAVQFDETVVDTFEANLDLEPGYKVDNDTALWWSDPKKRTAWEQTREGAMPAVMAMLGFQAWLKNLSESWSYHLEFLAKPAAFDIGWLQHWSVATTGVYILEKWRSWDLHSLMSIITGMPVTDCRIEDLPVTLWEDLKKNQGVEHVGVDDAIYQGKVGVRVIRDLQNDYQRSWSCHQIHGSAKYDREANAL